MAQQDLQESQPSTTYAPLVLVVLALAAGAYFGFVRPAQEHMQSLERQCSKLVIAVKKLQGKDDTARHGLRLINLLGAQSEKLASAEKALEQFSLLHERMLQETESMTRVVGALQQLEVVRREVVGHGETLTSTANTLSDMAEVSASIAASTDVARQANGSLEMLGKQQTELANNIANVSQQISVMEQKLSDRTESLPQAEQTLVQIDRLCQQLSDEAASVSTAQRQLGKLAQLKLDVIEQSANVTAAEAALDQIWDLKDGLLQAKNTLDKTRSLAIDMMLLEPVLDRLSETLKPTTEATRLSRREEAKAPKTHQSVTSNPPSPWSSAINVFVALLGAAE